MYVDCSQRFRHQCTQYQVDVWRTICLMLLYDSERQTCMNCRQLTPLPLAYPKLIMWCHKVSRSHGCYRHPTVATLQTNKLQPASEPSHVRRCISTRIGRLALMKAGTSESGMVRKMVFSSLCCRRSRCCHPVWARSRTCPSQKTVIHMYTPMLA